MSTSFLYHAFNLKGVRYISTLFSGDTIIFRAEMDCSVKCPNRGGSHQTFKGQKTRDFLPPPAGGKKCVLNFTRHRLFRRDCGNLWWPRLPFMCGKHRYARAFALTAPDLPGFGTIRSVAEYLGVGWDMVKDIRKTRLSIRYRDILLKKVRYIGIDEFSLKKGHT